MTDAELSSLEQAAKAATPGPWEQHEEEEVVATANSLWVVKAGDGTGGCTPEDAAFIAAANPAVVLELIQELRQARDYIRAFVEFHQKEATCQKS